MPDRQARRLGTVAVMLAAAATLAAHENGPYKLTNNARLGFYANASAFDAPRHRLYSSSRGGIFEIDTERSKVLGRVGDVLGPGSLAISKEHGELYLLGLYEDVVRVTDIASRKVVRTFAAPGAFNMFYEPSRGELYLLRPDTNEVRVLDRMTGRTVATIRLAGLPAFVLVDPARQRILVRLSSKDLVQIIDARERAIAVSWPLATDGPSAMAIDKTGTRVFAAVNRSVRMLDGLTGKEMARFPTGDTVRSMVFDSSTELVAALWGRSGVAVARVGTLGLDPVQNVETRTVVRQLFLDPSSHSIHAIGTLGEADILGINSNDAPANMVRTSTLLTFTYKGPE